MQKLGKIESKKREDYLRKLFYLMRLRPDIARMLKEKEKESNMPFILDREIDPLYKEGVEKGLEKGIEKGKKEAEKQTKIEIAKSMLIQKLPVDMIVSVTGLKKSTVEKILNDDSGDA
jgi:predicted transposase/invertase (TIGR01784 family)